MLANLRASWPLYEFRSDRHAIYRRLTGVGGRWRVEGFLDELQREFAIPEPDWIDARKRGVQGDL